ncbi:serine/threonine-protein phosphatase rdgC [Agrilus planipennis]|uniref:Serine/threonine-protein phosphatase with EF-hands n=1 Tax=Agrilus planipennis TaxID=224129 RepID=A0A1W4WIT1_AGRPL|nr:serine/threonine-protein phosphatase rdgC [Agrilus planipennis]XP_018320027.1 serine/threonine-protein phosphatase rdgC [Agrilus planipennis]
MMGFRKSKGCGCISFHKKSIGYEDESTSSYRSSDAEVTIPNFANKKSKSEGGFLQGLIPRNLFKGWRRNDDLSMTKIERTMKAAILIQRWYRRYLARMEVRRRYTWTIFQSIEYAGEHDQVRLYNFFNALLKHIPDTTGSIASTATSRSSSIDTLDMKFEDESEGDEDDCLRSSDRMYRGIHINFPMKRNDLDLLIETFRKKKHHRLHAKYVAGILKEAVTHLKRLPNLNQASTAISKQVTICGDLHGKLDDLLVVFHKNGLPSPENPYVFNGDFVDRGKKGLEVLLLLLACMLVFPGGVFLNRGNHEDHIMNTRYGFIREVQTKYKRNSEKLLKLIETVYRWLPLGTIVNNKVLIVHGGISDNTDLDLIRSLDRGKYVSLLRPPIVELGSGQASELIDKVEWKQVFDILWSDPQPNDGCIPNGLRGAGTYFGPDVTKSFLKRNKMIYLIRSHECKPDGYEISHNNKVITVFSASNYYELGSNKGAYLKLVGPQLDTHFVQFTTGTGKTKRLTFRQRIGLVESSAIRELRGHILSNKEKLEMEFEKADPEKTGYISLSEWCSSLEAATGLGLPWRMLKDKLVVTDPERNKVQYETTFDKIVSTDITTVQGASKVVETLYRNKSSLETIFRIIDKDNSGYISLEEFSDACNLIKEHMPDPVTQEQLLEICRLMDMNNDGLVDLNEFLETFRMVDPEQQGNDKKSVKGEDTSE